jgi:hypothetical protein
MMNPTPTPPTKRVAPALRPAWESLPGDGAVEVARKREAEARYLQLGAMVNHDPCAWRTATAQLACAQAQLEALGYRRALPAQPRALSTSTCRDRARGMAIPVYARPRDRPSNANGLPSVDYRSGSELYGGRW